MLDDLELFDALRDAKRAGKIRAFGLSLYGLELMHACIERWQVDTLQVDFNLFDQKAGGIFEHAQAAKVGIIARRPMDSGMLGGDLVAGAPFKLGDARQRWGEERTRKRQALLGEMNFLCGSTGRSRAGAALEFVLSHAAVSSAIPSTVNVEHWSKTERRGACTRAGTGAKLRVG